VVNQSTDCVPAGSLASQCPAIHVQSDGSLTLTLHVQPGAKRTEFSGLFGKALKLRLVAPPVDGKANACLLTFLGDYFGLAKNSVSLVSGKTSRQKVVRIASLSNPHELLSRADKLAHTCNSIMTNG